MAREMRRRATLRALVSAGVVGLGGCNIGNSTSSGSDSAASEGGSSTPTPTPEPVTWAEATRRVLDGSTIETLENSDINIGGIETKSDAQRVFSVVGWHRSVQRLGGESLQSIDDLLERSSEMQETLSEVESTLNRLDSLIREMKNTQIPITGPSVWEAAVTLAPSLQGFDAAVDESLGEVRTWLGLLDDVTDSLRPVRETITAVRNGQVQQVTALADRIDGAVDAIGELGSRTTEMRRTLSNYAEVTRQVASVAGQLGPLASKVGRVYGEASDRLERAASELRAFNDRLRAARSALSELESSARQTTSELLSKAEKLDPVASSETGDGSSSTPTPTPDSGDPTTPTERPGGSGSGSGSGSGFVEDFEGGPGDWSGDTGAIAPATDAARGSRAVKFDPGYAEARLNVPTSAARSYSFWWKVGSEASGFTVMFEDGDGTAGFGAGIRESGRGLEAVVNPDPIGSESGRRLYAPLRIDTWYKVAFTDVDFGEGVFVASLQDAGDVELTRIKLPFGERIDAVSTVAVRTTSDAAAYLDHVVVE